MGVCHSADIEPVFGIPFLDTKRFNDRERYISENMIDIFSTFAKTGKPPAIGGADWPEFYAIGNKTLYPYYEVTNYPKNDTNFSFGLKNTECERLFKPFVEN
ncbi:unnamed protein product [Oppiella nova]|uniref:Carboxylesterase type B domain-containing protein n=1 Tax=Oppiella nova TaxID=334625 RepID=A0A7R9MJT5_9ACAR|nr:unnamed protein product [Oppiella nova]CAG2178447.1 unnamed protein product [Oppiella nova]